MTAGNPEPDRGLPIEAGDSIVLDTSVLIAYLKGDEPVSDAARVIVEELVAGGRNPAVVSAISVAELMVRPLRHESGVPTALKTFLLGYPGLSVKSTDFLVAAEAARIRAVTTASLPDALIAATATLTSSRWLVTNDQVLHDRLSRLRWSTRILLLSVLKARDA